MPIEQLVPGDIVLLSAGDMIPADLRLISAKDLFINQSTLTGEAMPLEKVAAAHVGTAETPFDLPNICFMGSAVVSGIGCGVVVLTGAAHRLRPGGERRSPSSACSRASTRASPGSPG